MTNISCGGGKEIDLLDTMLSSLVELLEEKGILTQAEYEKRIMEKVKNKIAFTFSILAPSWDRHVIPITDLIQTLRHLVFHPFPTLCDVNL